MAVITKQELEDAAADAFALERIVNGSATENGTGLVTTRLGQQVKTAAKIAAELAAVDIGGTAAAAINQRIAVVENQVYGLFWRSRDAAALSADQVIAASAVKAVVAVGFTGADRGKLWRFVTISRNDPTFGDSVVIEDESRRAWSKGTSNNTPGEADGPVWITLSNVSFPNQTFLVLIDYRELAADGIAFNGITTQLLINDNMFYQELVRDSITQLATSTNSRLSALEDDDFGVPWRDGASTALSTESQKTVARAIKDIQAFGFSGTDRSVIMKVGIVAKNHPTLSDRFVISDQSNNWWSVDGPHTNKDTGPIWITTSTRNGGYFKVLIDYTELSDGLTFSTATGLEFKLSDRVFFTEQLQQQLDALAVSVAMGSWRDPSSTALTTDVEKKIQQAILKIEAVGMPRTDTYRITIFCNNDPTYGDNLFIYNGASQIWKSPEGTAPGKDSGPVWVKLSRAGETGYFNLLVDYRKITETGILFNSGASNKYKLSSLIFSDEKLRESINAISSSLAQAATVSPLGRAIRVAMAGSSITWGQGWLGESSYVGYVEDYLRNELASTHHATAMTLSGTYSTVTSPLFYNNSAVLLSGVGSKASFSLGGDELSLCIARERGNVGAALVELYVNGTLHDTFNTVNPIALMSKSRTFSGNGTDLKFDLGEAFTYNHTVTVGGVSKVVQMNTQGYGATFPTGVDVLVIRKIGDNNGTPEVHHILWFKEAPPSGTNNISVTFDSGTSITYMKGTVGQTSRPLTGTLESPYGDGQIAYDPDAPSSLSSGLGFRESDPRSVVTWKFDSSAVRNYEVRIASLDPQGTGTPVCYLNFATNRMHHVMNAGIGGWSAPELLSDTGLNGIDDLIRFQPDVVYVESCTNDDWATHVDRAWKTRTGLTDAQVRGEETANYFKTVTYVGPDNYTVADVRLTITAITETSITVEGTNATFEVVPGDVVIIGDFRGDNRRLACRLVKTWNAGTRTATWAKPLRPEELVQIQSLSELVGNICMFKGAPSWVTANETIIDNLRAALPNSKIALGTSGIPNIRHRRLEGYRELAEDICARKSVFFADFYGATLRWQYSQPPSVQQYLNASASTTATGASEYVLYNSNGTQINPLSVWLARNWSVKVNGVERINKGCYVVGGYKTGWAAGTTQMSKSNTAGVGDNYKLVFTSGVPASGDTIVVKYNTVKWASDDCHPGTEGQKLFGQAINAGLRHLAPLSAALPGLK